MDLWPLTDLLMQNFLRPRDTVSELNSMVVNLRSDHLAAKKLQPS